MSASEILRPSRRPRDPRERRSTDNISLPDRFKAKDELTPYPSDPLASTMAFAHHSLFGLIAAAQPASDHQDDGDGDDLYTEDLSRATPDLRSSEPTLSRLRRDHISSRSQIIAKSPASSISSRNQSCQLPTGDLPPTKTADALACSQTSSHPDQPADQERHSLPHALRDIFHFDQTEQVISEHPCWYLQSALLQGFMYITQRHVCFYAYLPPAGDNTIKSGHLSKRGKTNPRYTRYFFTLKGTVLSYFASDAALYYPTGNIDLRSALSAELAPDRDNVSFLIMTERRTYYLKADSPRSVKDWVKSVQTVIYRSQNDADSVKISLPIDNILDVEDCPVIDAADTIRVRVIDNDDTFAVDEYFFSFFGSGKDVLSVLTARTQQSSAYKALTSPRRLPHQDTGTSVSSQTGGKDTIIQTSPSRADGSLQQSQSSISQSDSHSTHHNIVDSVPEFHDEARDYHQTDPTASVILSGDGVFRDSTLKATTQISSPAPIRAQQVRHDQSESSGSSSPGQTSVKSHSGAQHDVITTSMPIISDEIWAPGRPKSHRSMSYTESLGGLVRAGTIQMRKANDLASMLRAQSKRVSSLVGRSSKGYYEKVYGMWAGGRKHYTDIEGLQTEDHVTDHEEESDALQAESRFREYFALPASERLVACFFGHILRVLPLYGKLYVGSTRLCFRSLLPGTRTKLILPYKDLMTVEKEKGFRFGYFGMVVVVQGHEEIFFEFASTDLRDDCTVTVLRSMDASQTAAFSSGNESGQEEAKQAAMEDTLLREAREHVGPATNYILPQDRGDAEGQLSLHSPTSFDDFGASVLEFKPQKPLKITCLTIGSRGDVQPYIALCKGLLAEGHKPTIATHKEFEPWVRRHGIDYAQVDGDPAELMRICVENGMFTPSFLYEANSKFRGFLDTLLSTAWTACQGSDVLIESPSAMAGIHIAEALQIPYFRAFTMPWTRTRAYPHAFAVPNHKMGGAYNYMTYVFFDNIFWQSTAGQINRWRRKVLGLHTTSLDRLQPNKVPFLYNFSPSVVMPPLDFSDWIRVTGYWFLDEGDTWQPPSTLIDFIGRARDDGVPLVYIGFGSIVVSDSKAMTATIVSAVQKAGVRCILSKGWSDRLTSSSSMQSGDGTETLPDCIYPINSAPHDWLFSKIDCAVHHGGAGTTGASLRAGVPTLITPFFGDQFFFANRVQDLGVGLYVQRIGEQQLGKALWIGTHDGRMRAKARALGEAIRREDGVGTAIKALWRDMEYANTLVKRRNLLRGEEVEEKEEGVIGVDESWTLVETDDEGTDVLSTPVSPSRWQTELGQK